MVIENTSNSDFRITENGLFFRRKKNCSLEEEKI